MINFVAVFLHKKDGHSTALLIFELPASSPRTSRAYFLVLTVLYHDKIKMHVTMIRTVSSRQLKYIN